MNSSKLSCINKRLAELEELDNTNPDEIDESSVFVNDGVVDESELSGLFTTETDDLITTAYDDYESEKEQREEHRVRDAQSERASFLTTIG